MCVIEKNGGPQSRWNCRINVFFSSLRTNMDLAVESWCNYVVTVQPLNGRKMGMEVKSGKSFLLEDPKIPLKFYNLWTMHDGFITKLQARDGISDNGLECWSYSVMKNLVLIKLWSKYTVLGAYRFEHTVYEKIKTVWKIWTNVF